MAEPRHTRVLIIGSGPAGYTAAVYAARANLNPILVQGLQPGGQLSITTDVENYPGFKEPIQGPWLMEQMQGQAERYGTEVLFDVVTDIDLKATPFTAVTDGGAVVKADTVVLATGAVARWLGLPSERHFMGAGVSACATCDGFFFKNRKVAVVGGGNTAAEEAVYLAGIAAKVTLIHRRDRLRAEDILQRRLFSNPKIEVLFDHVVEEVLGDDDPKRVTGLRLRGVKDGVERTLDADGVFIAIGHDPATELVKGQIETDDEGYVVTAPGSTRTNVAGVFAAGDVQDKTYRQAVTAAGSGCMAALEAERYLTGVQVRGW
ncbi:MAG: thioredoxin-disulfide reductase [Geminicoccaceae bacterium]|nr:thioredoxin-disulfide reductase [Geminicoccaceae bacterium]